jgi:signal peptide peptidase SppA
MKFLDRFFKKGPKVAVIRLSGAIGMGSAFRPGLSAAGLEDTLTRAFSRKGLVAVALVINCPGGSAAQSSLIGQRIRQLAEEKKLPVLAYVEDVAASGGYWLATAADEIYADETSIVGSIGVVAAGFGFTKAIEKLGVERRVYTAGKNKVMLDPFQPEKPEDVARVLELQAGIHEVFKTHIRARRGARLKAADDEVFTGAFWTGRKAAEMGLIDGIGEMTSHLKSRFGPDVNILRPSVQGNWLARRFKVDTGNLTAEMSQGLAQGLEHRALWGRYGL